MMMMIFIPPAGGERIGNFWKIHGARDLYANYTALGSQYVDPIGLDYRMTKPVSSEVSFSGSVRKMETLE
jgi:hypothetical protein